MLYRSFSQIGKKKVNEDYLKITHNAFIVCDGVGGEVKGELASKEVTEFLTNNLVTSKIDELYLQDLVIQSHEHLNSIVETQPDLEGMATTLAAVFFAENGLYTAHLGDSRVYILRPKTKQFWQTWDHSLVGNLVKSQEITREQARNHPMNNQINRAIKANAKGKLSKPEIHFVNDLRKDDIVFICSDGVSEAFSDFELLDLLASSETDIDKKLNSIKNKCEAESYDNNTAILCKLEQKDVPKETITPLDWIAINSLQDEENLDAVSPYDETEKKKKKSWFRFFE